MATLAQTCYSLHEVLSDEQRDDYQPRVFSKCLAPELVVANAEENFAFAKGLMDLTAALNLEILFRMPVEEKCAPVPVRSVPMRCLTYCIRALANKAALLEDVIAEAEVQSGKDIAKACRCICTRVLDAHKIMRAAREHSAFDKITMGFKKYAQLDVFVAPRKRIHIGCGKSMLLTGSWLTEWRLWQKNVTTPADVNLLPPCIQTILASSHNKTGNDMLEVSPESDVAQLLRFQLHTHRWLLAKIAKTDANFVFPCVTFVHSPFQCLPRSIVDRSLKRIQHPLPIVAMSCAKIFLRYCKSLTSVYRSVFQQQSMLLTQENVLTLMTSAVSANVCLNASKDLVKESPILLSLFVQFCAIAEQLLALHDVEYQVPSWLQGPEDMQEYEAFKRLNAIPHFIEEAAEYKRQHRITRQDGNDVVLTIVTVDTTKIDAPETQETIVELIACPNTALATKNVLRSLYGNRRTFATIKIAVAPDTGMAEHCSQWEALLCFLHYLKRDAARLNLTAEVSLGNIEVTSETQNVAETGSCRLLVAWHALRPLMLHTLLLQSHYNTTAPVFCFLPVAREILCFPFQTQLSSLSPMYKFQNGLYTLEEDERIALATLLTEQIALWLGGKEAVQHNSDAIDNNRAVVEYGDAVLKQYSFVHKMRFFELPSLNALESRYYVLTSILMPLLGARLYHNKNEYIIDANALTANSDGRSMSGIRASLLLFTAPLKMFHNALCYWPASVAKAILVYLWNLCDTVTTNWADAANEVSDIKQLVLSNPHMVHALKFALYMHVWKGAPVRTASKDLSVPKKKKNSEQTRNLKHIEENASEICDIHSFPSTTYIEPREAVQKVIDNHAFIIQHALRKPTDPLSFNLDFPDGLVRTDIKYVPLFVRNDIGNNASQTFENTIVECVAERKLHYIPVHHLANKRKRKARDKDCDSDNDSNDDGDGDNNDDDDGNANSSVADLQPMEVTMQQQKSNAPTQAEVIQAEFEQMQSRVRARAKNAKNSSMTHAEYMRLWRNEISPQRNAAAGSLVTFCLFLLTEAVSAAVRLEHGNRQLGDKYSILKNSRILAHLAFSCLRIPAFDDYNIYTQNQRSAASFVNKINKARETLCTAVAQNPAAMISPSTPCPITYTPLIRKTSAQANVVHFILLCELTSLMATFTEVCAQFSIITHSTKLAQYMFSRETVAGMGGYLPYVLLSSNSVMQYGHSLCGIPLPRRATDDTKSADAQERVAYRGQRDMAIHFLSRLTPRVYKQQLLNDPEFVTKKVGIQHFNLMVGGMQPFYNFGKTQE